MFRSYKWALLILLNVGLARVGGFLALLLTGTYLSVSSGVGMLALFGVSVQTGVIMLEYINQLRARGYTIVDAAVEGAVLRLRPIMMTMLVATLGLAAGGAVARHRLGLAAALCHRHCRRPDCRPRLEHRNFAHVLCLDRERHGQASGTGGIDVRNKPVASPESKGRGGWGRGILRAGEVARASCPLWHGHLARAGDMARMAMPHAEVARASCPGAGFAHYGGRGR